MKKFKSYLLAGVAAVSALMFAGSVNADSTATSFKVVCSPDSISASEESKCYVLAKVTDSIFAVDARITKLKDLELVGTSPVSGSNSNIAGEYLKNGQSSTTKDKNDKAYTCQNALADGKGCAVFISKNKTNQIMENKTGKAQISLSDTSDINSHTAIGFIQVKLAEEQSDAACGEICLSMNFTKAPEFADSTAAVGNSDCVEITKKITNSTTSNSSTGSFASYAVLAAGAFIAISAIAIAKKHNKFYRV